MILQRRRFLSLLAAPAIVRVASIMPVVAILSDRLNLLTNHEAITGLPDFDDGDFEITNYRWLVKPLRIVVTMNSLRAEGLTL